MDTIPDSPEALFEALAEPSIREIYGSFDSLTPRNQKLLRIFHTELTKGELTDLAFRDTIGFILSFWRRLNEAALLQVEALLDTEDEIDTDWVDHSVALARLDQYIISILHALNPIPGYDDLSDKPTPMNCYHLQMPESS